MRFTCKSSTQIVPKLIFTRIYGDPKEEGRKYSVSRIGEEDAVYVEWALISLILAGDLPCVGIKEDHCRRSERCIGGRKGS